MGLLFSFMIVAIALTTAMQMRRRQQALGIKTNWTKTLVTGAGAIVVCLCGIGVLVGGANGDHAGTAVVLALAIIGGGLFVLVRWVNRRWPIPTGRE
jgi:O-antigen/teichoic acid export membrane protein